MKRLLKLANSIKDKALRKKVVDLLKNPVMSHKDLASKYRPCDLKEAPASIQFHHIYKGGLVDHIYSVTLLSIAFAENLKKVYNVRVDMDALIAGALLHDIGKLWILKNGPDGWETTDHTLDHTMLGTAELYAREFPEKVVHIVASHFGSEGPTPPQTIEAVIFHHIDTLDALIGTNKQDILLQLLKK